MQMAVHQQLQQQSGADDVVPPRAVVLKLLRPRSPTVSCASEGIVGAVRENRLGFGSVPADHDPAASTGLQPQQPGNMLDHAFLVAGRDTAIVVPVKPGVPVRPEKIEVKRYTAPVILVDQRGRDRFIGFEQRDQLGVAQIPCGGGWGR